MKRKIVWILVSCLMALSLVMASCGPAEEEEEVEVGEEEVVITEEGEEEVVITEEEEEEEEEEVTAPETPQYGGTLTLITTTDIVGFDLTSSGIIGVTLPYTNGTLLGGDWAAGPAGTNEVSWTNMGYYGLKYERGNLAESWEIPEIGTMIFHIRKGIHYALDPNNEASRLMNGREFTADDAVFTFTRTCASPILQGSQPQLATTATFTAPDKWTVVMKTPVDPWTGFCLFALGMGTRQMAPEVIQKYGNQLDWRNSVGTGPFILTDLTPGAQAILIRNPNYWDKDPVGPGKENQLPYVDKLKFLVIPDTSTQLAAIRTSNVDVSALVTWDNAASLMKTNPELKYIKYLSDQANVISMRTDKPGLPYQDKRVRQALTMATDFETLKQVYGGQAETLVWPVPRQKGVEDLIDSIDMMPESVQTLYRYNPERAKELLAEAGYPNGFTAKILCVSSPSAIDPLSVVKDMWSKVDVNLEIQPLESGHFRGITFGRAYDEMIYSMALGSTVYANMINFRGRSIFNLSYWNDPPGQDPRSEAVYEEIQENLLINDAKTRQLFRELVPYLLEEAPVIQIPNPYIYTFWQPWVKNYHGERNVDYCMNVAMTWVWIDQDLKESMTRRR
jgi:peptide/nickel transport system substrate-binding protein